MDVCQVGLFYVSYDFLDECRIGSKKFTENMDAFDVRITYGGAHCYGGLGRYDQWARVWRESESGWADKGILCRS